MGVGEGPVVDHEVRRQHELSLLHQPESGVELCIRTISDLILMGIWMDEGVLPTVESEVGAREEHVLGVAGHHEQPVALGVDLVVRQQPLGRHAEHACTG